MHTPAVVNQFNPYFMTDIEILALNTGRERDLEFAYDLIQKNLKRKSSLQHLLIHGPRGIGKSFFLHLLQIKINTTKKATMILLPEEQMNIYQPSDLLKVIKNRFQKNDESGNIGFWFEESREEWNKKLEELNNIIKNDTSHLVVGIENFDLLFSKTGAFNTKENQFLLRQFLTVQTQLTFVASTLYPEIDSKYDQALFHTFVKYELIPWQESQHVNYLKKRAEDAKIIVKKISIAQLKALTQFTGGLPRITTIMADILN